MMETFPEALARSRHTTLSSRRRCTFRATASDILGNWFTASPIWRPRSALASARRQGFPRDRLQRLAARGDARSIIVKTILQAPRRKANAARYLVNGTPRTILGPLHWRVLAAGAGLDQPLRNLLTFEDARYYPGDAAPDMRR